MLLPFSVFFCFISSELKEQLLARSSRVDDIERLKTEFNEQKREIKQQNEAELESLRRYESASSPDAFILTEIFTSVVCWGSKYEFNKTQGLILAL